MTTKPIILLVGGAGVGREELVNAFVRHIKIAPGIVSFNEPDGAEVSSAEVLIESRPLPFLDKKMIAELTPPNISRKQLCEPKIPFWEKIHRKKRKKSKR